MILGTIRYMAPEQIEGKEADARSDIFAFGAVLFEMLTGRKAFEAASQAALMAAILDREPARVTALQPTVPPWLEGVVGRCLAKDPDQRWQSARELMRALQTPPISTAGQRQPLGSMHGAPLGWRARRSCQPSGLLACGWRREPARPPSRATRSWRRSPCSRFTALRHETI